MKAFVAGATGETGRRIVQQLVEQGVEVRAMVRDLEKAKALLPGAVELVQGDLLKSDLQKAMGDATKAKNIEQFILVSSLCVSKPLHPLNLFWGILVWKKWAEEYIQRSGLNYTIVRPGGLKNEDNDHQILMSRADTLFDGSIPRAKVAQVCVAAAQDSKARNKILEVVAKPDLPSRTIAELFEAVVA
jgi:uncharacterized protein YbjT (DUF2867 family)